MAVYQNYREYINFLINKYGTVKFPFFALETCRSANTKNARPGEALYIHHCNEDKYARLSNKEIAKLLPFENQMPNNLVYCNLYEHFLLHQKIILEGNIPVFIDGIDRLEGVVMHLIPNLCSRFTGKKFPPKQERLNVETKLIQPYRDEFVKEFARLYNYITKSTAKNAIEIRERYKRLNYNLKFPDFITQDKPGQEGYVPKVEMTIQEKEKYRQLLLDIQIEINKQQEKQNDF